MNAKASGLWAAVTRHLGRVIIGATSALALATTAATTASADTVYEVPPSGTYGAVSLLAPMECQYGPVGLQISYIDPAIYPVSVQLSSQYVTYRPIVERWNAKTLTWDFYHYDNNWMSPQLANWDSDPTLWGGYLGWWSDPITRPGYYRMAFLVHWYAVPGVVGSGDIYFFESNGNYYMHDTSQPWCQLQ